MTSTLTWYVMFVIYVCMSVCMCVSGKYRTLRHVSAEISGWTASSNVPACMYKSVCKQICHLGLSLREVLQLRMITLLSPSQQKSKQQWHK